MARIRTVKPEFYRHEALQELEIAHPGKYPMFVFQGLWSVCDNQGVFPWRPRQLKLDILPFLPFDFSDTLTILLKAGFVHSFSAEGGVYGLIPTIQKHQRFSGNEAGESGKRYPSPPSDPSTNKQKNADPPMEAIEKQSGSTLEAPWKHLGSNMEATLNDQSFHIFQEREREREREHGKEFARVPGFSENQEDFKKPSETNVEAPRIVSGVESITSHDSAQPRPLLVHPGGDFGHPSEHIFDSSQNGLGEETPHGSNVEATWKQPGSNVEATWKQHGSNVEATWKQRGSTEDVLDDPLDAPPLTIHRRYPEGLSLKEVLHKWGAVPGAPSPGDLFRFQCRHGREILPLLEGLSAADYLAAIDNYAFVRGMEESWWEANPDIVTWTRKHLDRFLPENFDAGEYKKKPKENGIDWTKFMEA